MKKFQTTMSTTMTAGEQEKKPLRWICGCGKLRSYESEHHCSQHILDGIRRNRSRGRKKKATTEKSQCDDCVPCEVQVWQLVLRISPIAAAAGEPEPVEEEIVLHHLGYFATEELAVEEGTKRLGPPIDEDDYSTRYGWFAAPCVLSFKGGREV